VNKISKSRKVADAVSTIMDEKEKTVLRRRRPRIVEKLQLAEDLAQDLISRQLVGPETIKDIMVSFNNSLICLGVL